jgi:hypothetical protein
MRDPQIFLGFKWRIHSADCRSLTGGEQPVEKGRAKLPLSRKHRELRSGRSLTLPKMEFFNGQLSGFLFRILGGVCFNCGCCSGDFQARDFNGRDADRRVFLSVTGVAA